MTNLELAICEAENAGEIDLDTRNELLGILSEGFGSGFKKLFGNSTRANVGFTFDAFIKELERRVDAEKVQRKGFEGGKAKVSRNGKSVSVNVNLYYENNGKWEKRNITYSVPLSHFKNDDITTKKLDNLYKKPLEFDVT